MAHPLHHAESSARKFGGTTEDYIALHSWFDASKAQFADFRHRALRHHAHGIFEAETVFGSDVINTDGRRVPTRFLGEQHVREDCGGTIPSLFDWLSRIDPAPWMSIGHLGDPVASDLSRDPWIQAVQSRETVLGWHDWQIAQAGPSGIAGRGTLKRCACHANLWRHLRPDR